MPRVAVIFSKAAQTVCEEHDFETLKADKGFRSGYDYKELNFRTQDEANAYIEGIQDQAGWLEDPLYFYEK